MNRIVRKRRRSTTEVAPRREKEKSDPIFIYMKSNTETSLEGTEELRCLTVKDTVVTILMTAAPDCTIAMAT